MAIVTNLVGVDLTVVDNSGSQRWPLGMEVFDKQDGAYIYAQSTASTFALGSAVVISKVGGAALLTTAKAKQGGQIAFSLGAVTTRQYAWFQVSGPAVSVKLKNTCVPGVPLYTTATAGTLHSTQGNGTSVAFVLGVRSNGITATSTNAVRTAFVVSGGASLLGLTGLTQ